jgi:hypothetical protein
MSEPTIDEMLDWLDQWEGDNGRVAAIRAILEQHRDGSMDAIRAVISEERGRDLLIIRAFVERIDKRLESMPSYATADDAIREELAAMEKENEPSS